MKKTLLLTLVVAALCISCGKNAHRGEVTLDTIIFPAGGIASTEYNTGKVHFEIMKDSGNTMITNFLFTAGSRNFWHYQPTD